MRGSAAIRRRIGLLRAARPAMAGPRGEGGARSGGGSRKGRLFRSSARHTHKRSHRFERIGYTAQMLDLAPGALLAGYRIESLIGRGGMGVVYRATQIRLERVVALKVIAPELLDDDDVRRRFLAEARAAASVDHPNVIPVHDAGAQDGIAFIAMRYVPGDDLRSLVRRGGALDRREAAELVAQAAAALDAIHRSGFVHRDVKPANLLVDGDRHVYLTDFGLAKAVLTQTGGTRTGHWVGTLDYVAPEQIRGGASTPARTSTRSAACCTTRSRGACRSSARATRRSCGRSCRLRRRCPRRCSGVCTASSTWRSRAPWPRRP